MSTTAQFKVGDKLEYIGPARTIYECKKSHPSFYQNHRITEIVKKKFPELAKILYGKNTVFAFVRCEQRDHPEIICGGYKLIKPEHWRIL